MTGGTRRSGMLRWGLLVVAALASAFAVYRTAFRSPASERPQARNDVSTVPLLPAGSDAGYVDAVVCSGCHSEIWAKYQNTGMGRSLARPRPQAMTENFKGSNTFYHEASDSHFTMYENGGKYYQRRHQISFDGQETNVVQKEIHL